MSFYTPPKLWAAAGCGGSVPATARTIHQIWWKGQPPVMFDQLRGSWSRQHPNWTYKLWDESAVTELVDVKYSWFAETFRAVALELRTTGLVYDEETVMTEMVQRHPDKISTFQP